MTQATQSQIDYIRHLKSSLGMNASDENLFELSSQDAQKEIQNLKFKIEKRG